MKQPCADFVDQSDHHCQRQEPHDEVDDVEFRPRPMLERAHGFLVTGHGQNSPEGSRNSSPTILNPPCGPPMRTTFAATSRWFCGLTRVTSWPTATFPSS